MEENCLLLEMMEYNKKNEGDCLSVLQLFPMFPH